LFVLLTEAYNDDVRRLDPVACADRVDLGALVVMPELVLLPAEDRDTAIIAGCMVGYGAGEGDVEPLEPSMIRSRQSVWISPDR
jgi:hypothetical protein